MFLYGLKKLFQFNGNSNNGNNNDLFAHYFIISSIPIQ